MDIVILGILLVAAMVFISTRIKRAAAAAFEPESVEMDDFHINKPAGFLYPLNRESEFPFEAYSREYGERRTRNIWRARTRLRVSDGLNIRKVIADAKEAGEDILAEEQETALGEGLLCSIVKSKFSEDEISYERYRRIIADKKRNKTYELRSTLLHPFEDDYREDIETMSRSFELKPTDSR
ncbi:MAG: hypothetical protein R2684_04650 [Pyrinomonadaceae bacterium]